MSPSQLVGREACSFVNAIITDAENFGGSFITNPTHISYTVWPLPGRRKPSPFRAGGLNSQLTLTLVWYAWSRRIDGEGGFRRMAVLCRIFVL